MKSKLYYVLYFLYAIVIVFVLYLNGVFTGEEISIVNLAINVGFLIIIGVLFVISSISFGRLNRITYELEEVGIRLQKEYREAEGKNLWGKYRDNDKVFEEELGTFLGLSMGLGAFSGDDIFTISDNVGSLLSGMKVAFHTSVYGIFFSLVFNLAYRSIMSDAYETLHEFLNVFRQTAQPYTVKDDESTATMLVYQAGMANSLKQMLELMKGSAAEQTTGVEHIVDKFTEQMQAALDTDFKKLGNALKNAGESQAVSARNAAEMVEAVTALVEVNRNVQDALAKVMERQEHFAKGLEDQKKMLADACSDMNDEISSQIYTFGQMRNLYEK
ncbi:MAG: hypothetical protein HFI57_14960 [Lachnospiraceae bacterium]|nr:hypothetical protein [Lachnospiraceae bacterium]